MGQAVREATLAPAAIRRALAHDADPAAFRRLIRAIAPLIGRAVARQITPGIGPPEQVRQVVAQRVEAIIAEWFAAPERVLLARRPRGMSSVRWLTRCAARAAMRTPPMAWEAVDDPRLPAATSRAATERFIAQLGAWERAVFRLIYVERRAPAAAAALLGVDGTVIEQARGRLRAALRRFIAGEPR